VDTLVLQQPPPLLDQHIQDLALVVYRAPQVHRLPRIRTPTRPDATCPSAAIADASGCGDQRPKLADPAAHGFTVRLDPTLSEQFSTSRMLSMTRKYNHTAWRITSGGNRWRLRGRFLIVCLPAPAKATMAAPRGRLSAWPQRLRE
jgi:hypothetical protein